MKALDWLFEWPYGLLCRFTPFGRWAIRDRELSREFEESLSRQDRSGCYRAMFRQHENSACYFNEPPATLDGVLIAFREKPVP